MNTYSTISTMAKVRIMVVDDHKMFLEGIVSLLKGDEAVEVVTTAKDGLDALKFLKNNQNIDVLITDISMPQLDGSELSKKIHRLYPHINILVLSMHSTGKTISQLLKNGATGYILKNTGKEELIEAIHTVAKGETFFSNEVKNNVMNSMMGNEKTTSIEVKLTRREVEIIRLIASEFTTQEIADKLYISLHTVESHRKNIMRKVDVRNLAGLIKYAIKVGLTE